LATQRKALDQYCSAREWGASRRAGAFAAPYPLTHHEILGLIEPFTRRGRHVDLAASNRVDRRLVFKPFVHAGDTPACAGACEILTLESARPEVYRLVRTLTLPGGAAATLVTDGPSPGELLARVEAVAPRDQFQLVANVSIARSYRLEPPTGCDPKARGRCSWC